MMPPRPTKVAGEKATAIPGGTSGKTLEVKKKSTAVQKQLAKHTAKPTRSPHNVSVVSITLTTHNAVICTNRLLPSLIKPAAVKKSNLVMKTRRTIPHLCRRTNLNLKIWILCSTPLLVCVPRTPGTVTNPNELLTSHTFSSWLKSGRWRSEYASYARKSCIIHQQAPINSILVTSMAMRAFQRG
jgi:hypothetical protein